MSVANDLWMKGGVPVALPGRAQDAQGMWWDDLANNPDGRTACGFTEPAPPYPDYDPATQTPLWQDGAWVLFANPPATRSSWLSVYDFWRLFTEAEGVGITNSPDAKIIYFRGLIATIPTSGANLNLADPMVVGGVDYLETAGLIAAGRAAQVLANQAPPAS